MIEILSERTAADDLGTKLLEYQAIPSIRDYLVIDSRKRWAVLYVRDEQEFFVAPRDFIAGQITLASIDYELDLDALYERARISRGTAARIRNAPGVGFDRRVDSRDRAHCAPRA